MLKKDYQQLNISRKINRLVVIKLPLLITLNFYKFKAFNILDYIK